MSKITDHRAGTLGRRFATLIAARNPLRQQAEDWAEGLSRTTESGSVSGGGPADPTLAKILRTPIGHGLADQATDVADRIDAWIRYGNALAFAAQRLLPLDHPVAEMLAKHRDIRQAGAGVCQRCHRDVPGIRENPMLGIEADRLKAGFCYGQPPHCYAAWVASGMVNRARFIHDWKTVSGTAETAGHTLGDTDGVQLGASGAEVRPDTQQAS